MRGSRKYKERGEEVKRKEGGGGKLTANDDDCSQYDRRHMWS